MDHSFDEDDMGIEINEYPDPEYTPRFAWLGMRNASPPSHTIESLIEDAEPSTSDDYGSGHSSPVADQAYLGQQDGGDANGLSRDADFQYQDDSDESDVLTSEADSDSDSPSRSMGGERGRTTRGGRRARGAAYGSWRGQRGRGRPRGRRGLGRVHKGVKRGIRKPLEPSEAFKDVHSQATVAFVDRRYSDAEDLAKQAIQLNPEIFTSYSLLSEIHVARNDKARAMTALFNGAHTRPNDTDVWCKVAKLIMEVAGDGDNRRSAIQDAIYCYNRVLDTNRLHFEARFERAGLHREAGSSRRAALDYSRLIKQAPHDNGVLRHLAETYIDLGECGPAIARYETSIAHYRPLDQDTAGAFNWSDLNIYAELFMSSTDPAEFITALSKVKSVSRWLLRRGDEHFWDNYNEDDREFDAADELRRAQVPEYIPGSYDLTTYGEGLPLEIRMKLGLFRLNLGDDHLDEAMAHFDWLEPDNDGPEGKLLDFPDLFREVADALRTKEYWREALQFYDPLQLVEEHTDPAYFSDMASCYEALAMYDEAEDCIRVIIENDEQNIGAWIQIATMFDNADMPERAAPYVDQVIAMKRVKALERKRARSAIQSLLPTSVDVNGRAPSVPPEEPQCVSGMIDSIPAQKAVGKRTKRQAEEAEIEQKVQSTYLEMRRLRERLRMGEAGVKSDWMDGARSLIDYFKKHKSYSPMDRNTFVLGSSSKERKAKGGRRGEDIGVVSGRLQNLLADIDDEEDPMRGEYYGIDFETWLDIFLEYAIFLAQEGETALAYDTVSTASRAKVFFQSKDRMFLIHVVWFSCAIIVGDDETLCNVARYFTKEYQFITDSYRLFSALNRLSDRPNKWYNSGASQKYILRQIKAMDFALNGEKRTTRLNEQKASFSTRDEAGNPILPKEMDIALLMLYGHMLYYGSSYSYSLNYFYRAYALEPQNPMINLSLALGYIHYALKRQSENRHHLIMQGFSFLFAYYDLRKVSKAPSERQEGEFNVGRAYHLLGLTHLAIPFYERCLVISEDIKQTSRGDAVEDFATEAAFALQGIWAANGEVQLAQKVTEKWLVL